LGAVVYGDCANCDCVVIRSVLLRRWVHIYPCGCHPAHPAAPGPWPDKSAGRPKVESSTGPHLRGSQGIVGDGS